MTRHSGPVLGLAFSSDHSYLASCSVFGVLNIWNPSTNWSILNNFKNGGVCFALIQLPNARLAFGSGKNINIWSPLTKEDGPIRTLTGHSNYVKSLALSPDKTILASGSFDHKIMLWNYKNESTAFKTLTGHQDWVTSVCFVSNQILASGSLDNTIKIWNIKSGIQNSSSIPFRLLKLKLNFGIDHLKTNRIPNNSVAVFKKIRYCSFMSGHFF